MQVKFSAEGAALNGTSAKVVLHCLSCGGDTRLRKCEVSGNLKIMARLGVGGESLLSDDFTREVSGGRSALPIFGPHRQRQEDVILQPLHEIIYLAAHKPG